jgi:hypothetical protein
MRFVRLIGTAAVVGALLSGGFAATANASSALPAPCWLGNHRDLHLTAADNGRQLRVCRGAKIDVTLKAPFDAPMWSAVSVSGGAVPVDRHHPHVFLPRGVTAGWFVATRRGSAELTSSRATCAPNPGGPTCHSMQGWKVDISVR